MEPLNSLLSHPHPVPAPPQQIEEPEGEADCLVGPVQLGSYALHIERLATGHVLRLLGPEGEKSLEIALTPQGPVLRLHSGLRMDLLGDLMLEARHVSLHGREGLTLTSGTDAAIVAAGDLVARAELGDLALRANDDVRLDGERIRMNC